MLDDGCWIRDNENEEGYNWVPRVLVAGASEHFFFVVVVHL